MPEIRLIFNKDIEFCPDGIRKKFYKKGEMVEVDSFTAESLKKSGIARPPGTPPPEDKPETPPVDNTSPPVIPPGQPPSTGGQPQLGGAGRQNNTTDAGASGVVDPEKKNQ